MNAAAGAERPPGYSGEVHSCCFTAGHVYSSKVLMELSPKSKNGPKDESDESYYSDSSDAESDAESEANEMAEEVKEASTGGQRQE